MRTTETVPRLESDELTREEAEAIPVAQDAQAPTREDLASLEERIVGRVDSAESRILFALLAFAVVVGAAVAVLLF